MAPKCFLFTVLTGKKKQKQKHARKSKKMLIKLNNADNFMLLTENVLTY